MQRLSSLNFLPSLPLLFVSTITLIVFIHTFTMATRRSEDLEVASCDFSEIVQYLTNGSYPKGTTKDLKRRIRERAKIFYLESTELRHMSKDGKSILVVMNAKRKEEIMLEAHAGPVGGCHYGQNITVEKVTERFWWPSIGGDVRAHVRGCAACQKANPLNSPLASTLHPIAVKHVFHRWGIDLIGPLQTTPNGNKYIVVATEYLTKWVEAKGHSG